jgi:hypothetical protein
MTTSTNSAQRALMRLICLIFTCLKLMPSPVDLRILSCDARINPLI